MNLNAQESPDYKQALEVKNVILNQTVASLQIYNSTLSYSVQEYLRANFGDWISKQY